ncbi:MAG: hypothetical protein ACE5K7_01225, partial [Phycisphaerae bacterium]
PDRRLCGLSLVEQTGQLGLMARVLQLARHDPDEPVRHRAQALASTLRQALRRSQPAGPQELVP